MSYRTSDKCHMLLMVIIIAPTVIGKCDIVTDMETFGTWLAEELDRRGWSMSELARRVNVTHAAISRVISGERNPSGQLCVSIAETLEMIPHEVLAKAGILPDEPADDRNIIAMRFVFSQLSPEAQEAMIAQARALLEHEKEKGRVATAEAK